MNRTQAISATNAALVAKLEATCVDFSNRNTDGTAAHGYTEFVASVDCKQRDDESAYTLTMYLYVKTADVIAAETLDAIDWPAVIAHAEFALT